MKTTVFLLIAMFSLSAFAQYEPWCGRYYRYDSYGFGLKNGMTGTTGKPKLIDLGCYTLGLKEGQRIKEEYTGRACTSAFNDSQEQGFEGDIQVIGSPSECSNAGYSYGASLLHVGAREGRSTVVGFKCLKAYAKGDDDARNLRMMTLGSDNQINECYRTGYFDFQFLKDVF